MSHVGSEPSKGPSSPHRPRHQISRSISELSSPIRLHRHHSHRAAKERDRDAPSPVAQTTAPSNNQGRLSLDGPPSAAVTPNLSPNPSRRTSILFASTGESSNTTTHPLVSMSSTAPIPSTTAGGPNAVTTSTAPPLNSTATLNNRWSSSKADDAASKERMKAAAARESGLKTTLSSLESFQTASTRRLDDTYYSVLERLGALQSTIMALKELAGLSRDMNHTFTSEASELVTDTSSQLDAFGQFEDQQQRIETLQGRVHVGRDKIKGLSERVDKVKERIERWERADREWQERTRRRLRVIWVVTSVVVFLVLLLVVSAQYAAPGGGIGVGLGETTTRIADDSLNAVKNVTAGGKDMLWNGSGCGSVDDRGGGKDELGLGDPSEPLPETDSMGGTGTGSSTLVLPSSPSSDEDSDLLRAFDEL